MTVTLTTLVSFDGTNGSAPASLIADAHGDLFGTTESGGAFSTPNVGGTVFEIVNNGSVGAPSYASTPTTLVSFDGTNGSAPASLIADNHGDLFGTTFKGGIPHIQAPFGQGTVFEIVNNGSVGAPHYASTPTTLVEFNNRDGAFPTAGLIADNHGDLFGTTAGGGANGNGTVFEIVNNGTVGNPSYASTPTTLVEFNNSDGAFPTAGLIADNHGDLFGTTFNGGANGNGTVFEIVNNGTVGNPSYASTPTTLVSFDGTNGSAPASLIADNHGDLFGTTAGGGANDLGTVFEIVNNGSVGAPSYASTPTTLVSFDGTNGSAPASLIADNHGNLFGTTEGGGANGVGTVFEIADAFKFAPNLGADPPPGNVVSVSHSQDGFVFASHLGESPTTNFNVPLDPPHSALADFAASMAQEHDATIVHDTTDLMHVAALPPQHVHDLLV
jgi:uncharacterized repeat protein (TIGR03803 family)